ncbi:PepSY domain-containing protein [Pseudomonas costantinii]|uniref:Peptidase n=1 Tax=Pseudomonas costantinii TaxID=168469 RepID=A0A1S2V525_9PSED|nr:PepSY domain-containing protein [Pseudomonas costantinii]NVZ22345.1 PepSY domain-containing protein [Pseudomonas costantinii]NVZ72324.1 PepSY domain-containing protein [Pseudomonas costantinii]OIN53804.1 peptidase [Pseudomonas costantinii]SEE43544.1 Uncharacterized membrane protein YkoI [Pseudomonas costantinii]
MKVNLRASSGVALVFMAFCSSLAARDLNQDEALALRQQGVILPLEQLLQQAMARYPGSRLLEAELEKKHGQYAYEVELVTTEGVVREIKLDAATGVLLQDKEDD